MNEKIAREVNFLKMYVIFATLACVAMFAFLFVNQGNYKDFEEINVERINIVEKDGQLRMVISNKERQHPGIVNGKVIERTYPRPPGMIFFNQLGDEMGGLVFGENGGDGHFGSLTFDKVRGDQTIGFRYLESDNGTYTTGLEIWQQPNIPGDIKNAKYQEAAAIEDEAARDSAIQVLRDNLELTSQRLFLGKWRNNKTALVMSDIKGNPRIMMTVTAEGTAKLEFLDESGKVIHSLP